ncbi:MAG: hypothetical protein IJB00_08825 [Akkermansia sp.]|nr:hypothetical protein [Akkermansia sp.]
MLRRIFTATALVLLLSQCQTISLEDDCRAIVAREAEIATEARGDYYIGRRYYIPNTRFWGYLRRPGESWRNTRLVMMDESIVRTPDRGMEPPAPNAVYGTDANVEYIIRGEFTGKKAYDPSSNQVLPMFRAISYEVRNRKPGFLFKPSEQYSTDYVTLMPSIMPSPSMCEAMTRRNPR